MTIDLKKFATAVAISGVLGFSALGLGAAVANATPVAPQTGPVPWSQDDGDGHDWHGHGHDDWGPRPWRGVGWPGGCVAATDPAGLVSGQFCI